MSKPLSIHLHSQCTYLPLVVDQNDRFGYRFGVVDEHLECIDEFRLKRFWGESNFSDIQAPEQSVLGDVIYGGVIFDHFGHFLLETLARAWWLKRNQQFQILWHGVHLNFAQWQLDILRLVGLDTSSFTMLSQPTRISHLHNAQPGFEIGLSFDNLHANELACVNFVSPRNNKRVWLSRSHLPSTAGRVENEGKIEAVLKDRGWTIFSPESSTVLQQLAMIQDATTIAGFEGSAFHLLVLARDCRAKIRVLSRNTVVHPNYEIIANVKNLDQKIKALSLSHVSGEGTLATNFSSTSLAEIIDFVNE